MFSLELLFLPVELGGTNAEMDRLAETHVRVRAAGRIEVGWASEYLLIIVGGGECDCYVFTWSNVCTTDGCGFLCKPVGNGGNR